MFYKNNYSYQILNFSDLYTSVSQKQTPKGAEPLILKSLKFDKEKKKQYVYKPNFLHIQKTIAIKKLITCFKFSFGIFL